MKTPFIEKVRRFLYKIARKLTGHEYGCCGKVFKRCSDCVYVKTEASE